MLHVVIDRDRSFLLVDWEALSKNEQTVQATQADQNRGLVTPHGYKVLD